MSWRRAATKVGKKPIDVQAKGLVAGLRVTPRVELVAPLGAGAMGCVWRAKHHSLGIDVAVKFISEELAPDDPEVVERFRLEASAAARIKSPHVVQTLDHGVMANGLPFIVMELLDGETLGERLDRVARLSIDQVEQVVVEVGKVLHRAQELGIVHRDIKPDNIFLSSSDDGLMVKVLDFGVAKEMSLPELKGLTLPGMLVGTPEFMSPELIVSSKNASAQSDMWALAAVAYLALTSQLPFAAETLGDLCMRLLRGEFQPPSDFVEGLPKTLDAFFERAFAREPEQRFVSAKEMAIAFIEAIPAEMRRLEAVTWTSGCFSLPPELRAAAATGSSKAVAPVQVTRPDGSTAIPDEPSAGDAMAWSTLSRKRQLARISVAAAVALVAATIVFAIAWSLDERSSVVAPDLLATADGSSATIVEPSNVATPPVASAASEPSARPASPDRLEPPDNDAARSPTPASRPARSQETAPRTSPDRARSKHKPKYPDLGF